MKSKILLVLSLLFINYTFSQNLLTNPGFELGSSGVGFQTNGAGYAQLTAPYTGTTVTGNFAVVNNPNTINNADFIYEGDHTTGIGKMLVIDGNTTAGNPRFWKAGGTGAGVTTAVIGVTYRFSYWIKSVSNLGSPADIGIQITGGTPPVLVSGSAIAPAPSQSWRHVVYTFVATATTVQIELWNNNLSGTGNDFAVDDMMLTDDLMVSYNVTNAACATPNDGSVTVTGIGGTPPYVNYNITGGAININNTTGVFPNLPPGTYSVTVTDSALPTAGTATLTNVVVGPKITVPVNSAICEGSSITLNAAGSPSGYTWSASPAATSGLAPGDVNLPNPTVTPTATTTYTVTSTVGACAAISGSVTITVNPLPNVTSPSAAQTICPGNTATFIITGTPNSVVTISSTLNPIPFTTTVSIGPAGTGTFTTLPLNSSEIYQLIKIKGFFTLCERLLPPGLTLSVTVVPNGCATVRTDPAPNTPPLDLTLCTTGECRTLHANFSDVPSTTTYAVTSIPYCPYPFTGPSYTVVPITAGDDFWSPLVNLPFDFCFYGQNRNSCHIGTNGLISFRSTIVDGTFCDWPDTSVPISGQNQPESIYGVFQDTDMGVPPTAPDGQVNWVLEGQYPCRKLIVNFYHLGQWNSTATNPGLQTSQIVLYEVSNIIEVFVQRRVAGAPWAGSGAIGLLGAAGQWIAAPGRNTGAWSVITPEAWRFTPTGPNVPVLIDWFEGSVATGTHIGSGPDVQVCPTTTTTYTLQATYTVCNVQQHATTTTTLNVHPDSTGAPNDLTLCVPNCAFDLTANNSVILGSLPPADYDITYHTSQADADGGNNPIPNPTAYCPSSSLGTYTVYASIFLNSYNCHVVKPFNLIVDNCAVSPHTVPDLTLCDDISNDGTEPFDFTPQIAAALVGYNAADYNITFHNTQAEANAGTPAISPITAVPGVEGQLVVIRMTEIADPTVFGTTTFHLHVNPMPNATISGTTTICSGNNAVITFTGTPNAVIDYTVDGNPAQIPLNASGNASVTTPNLTINSTYTLVSIENTTTNCTRTLTGSATVTVRTLPTATIAGTTTVCRNAASPNITFTGANGTAPYTFTYSTDGGTTTITTGPSTGNVFTLPVSTATAGTFTYTLISVQSSGTPACSQAQSGTATVTVNPLPTATISGTTTVCRNDPSPDITFTGADGTAPYFFTYSTDGGTTTITSPASTGNTYTIPVATGTAGTYTYTLISVQGSGTPACSQAQAGSATVTVNALPTATISGTTSVCKDAVSPNITFTGANGTAPYTFTYSTDGGTTTITTPASTGNTYTLPVPTNTAGTFTYTLISVQSSGTPACSQTQAGSATVTVVALPTATISGTTTVCRNTPSPNITFTGANGTAPYFFTYSTDGGTTTITSPASTGNTYTIPVATGTAGTFTYTLISVQSSGALGCSQAQSGTATVTVNALPTATISGTAATCLNSPSPQIVLTGFGGTAPYTFTYSINTVLQPAVTTSGGDTYTINVPTNPAGTFTYDLVSVTEGSPLACTQAQTGSAVVTVAVAPIINTPTDYVVCDDSLNNDGFYCAFDLTTKDAEVTSDPTVVVTYHETQTDADTGGSPIASPYCNLYPGDQIIYVRAYFAGAPACYSTTSFHLIVNPIPIPNTNIPDFKICDYNAPVNQEVFDLGSWIPQITSLPGVTITFYDNPADAQTQTAALPNFYPNTSNPQQIWFNIADNATGCNTTGSFNLVVNLLPNAVTPPTIFECSNGAVLTAIFDLTVNEDAIRNGVPGLTVSWYNTPADAQSGNFQIGSPSNYPGSDNEIVYVRVQDDATGCYSTTTQLLRVTQGPLAVTPQPLQYCDPNNDGFGEFDLNDATDEITGGPLAPGSGVSVSYHETPDDASIGANPIPLNTPYNNIDPWSQILYVRVFYTLTGCANYVQLKLNVNPTPEATQPAPYELCDYSGAVGHEAFNLTTRIPEILGGINPATVTVSFYHTLTDAQAPTGAIVNVTNYTNVPVDTETLYVRVEDITTGCYDIVTLTLVVNPLPNSLQPNYPQYSLCDNDQSRIGYEVFDLAGQVDGILLGQTGMSVAFYPSLGDAQSGTGQIMNLMYENTIQYVQTLGIVITNQATGCYVISTMDIRVEPLPSLIPPSGPYTLCDQNQDGFTSFDLTTLIPGMLGGVTSYTVSFHET
ncbi:MAG: hypothetical protein WC662_04060, partial [Candidatus Paceibacterota bacterium]